MQASSSAPDIRFERLGIAQGMSQNTALALIQDRQGFLWIGTYDGLNRYDGVGFRVFRHNQRDSASLPKNWISALFEDKKGALWVGTNGGGLARYNPSNHTFTTYRHDSRSSQKSLPSDEITSIAEDIQGNVWVGTRSGLCQFNATAQTFTPFADVSNGQRLPNESIQTLYTDREGHFWIGTRNGLCVYDVRSKQLQTLVSEDYGVISSPTSKYQQSLSLSPSNKTSAQNLVQVILQDRVGTMWIGSRGALYMLRKTSSGNSLPLTFSGTMFTENPANLQGLASSNVQSLLEDRSGSFWIGSKNGLHLFNRETQTFTRFQNSLNDPKSLSDDFVMTMLQDKSGIIWFGTSGGGLSKYDTFGHRFPLFSTSPRSRAVLTSNSANAFCEDDAGAIWAGTDDGINIINRKTGQVRVIHQANTPLLANNHVRSLAFNARNRIMWIGTDNGLNAFDIAKNTWKNYTTIADNTNSLISNRIISVALDSIGTVWIGTFDGLSSFSPRTNEWKQFHADPANAGSLTNNIIFGIVPESDGTLWIGTDGGGLNHLDSRTGAVIETYRHKEGDSTKLSSDYILFLSNDVNTDRLIIGTDGGVNIFNKRTKRITTYSAKDGLPNDIINAVLADARGRYWISTNKGITCLDANVDGNTRLVRNFDTRDGLQSDEFNTGAYLRTHDGTLFFGGIAGFNAFHPDSILQNTYSPPLVFTGFRKFNKPATLDTAIEIAQEIIVPYSDNTISFEFAALSYTFSERNIYSYQLEGLDKAWIDADNKHEATYTNLDGGTYTFRVKAANNDGVWNETGIAVRLVVVPPIWKTLWFRLLVVIGVVVSGFSLYVYRVRQIQTRNQELERIVEERTSALTASAEQLSEANNEIQRQLDILSDQTVEIELSNSELQEMNVQLEKSYSNIQKLSEMGHNITATLDTVRIASAAFNSFDALIDTSIFVIREFDEDKREVVGEYVVEHGVHLQQGESCSQAMLENEPYLALSVEERKEIIIDNISEYHKKQALKRSVPESEAMNSLVSIPLLVEDRLIGVISVQTRQHNAYSAYHLDIIRTLASTTAIALDNARAYKAVQDLNSEKNLLLGVVAHDLKTPLSGIILAASNVEAYFERMSREQVLERVKGIKKSAFNMAHFIEDLLDVSAIESGKIRLYPENIALGELLPRLIEQQREQAGAKKIHVLFYGTDEPIRAFADIQRTEQVFDNILSNAIKFSPLFANVYVSVWGAEEPAVAKGVVDFLSHTVTVRDTMVFFAVRDEGPGISEDDRKNLFGKFARLSAQPTAGEHSSGLGLAIVKRLVETMGGQVWCESVVGEGTTFFVALPRAV